MNQDVIALYAVQETDTALLQCARRLRSLDNGTAEKEAAQKAAADHEAVVQELQQAQAALRDAELELKSLEAKRKEHSDRLYSGRIGNPKELDSLQREVEALSRRIGSLDETVLQLMDRVEALTAREAELRATRDRADAAYRAKAEAYVRSARNLRDEMARLQAQRKERAAAVPSALLKRYEAVRATKDGVGVARVEGSRCGVCRTILPKNTLLSAMETDAIVTCESCGRLLFAENH